MRIVAVQHGIVWEDKVATCANVRALLAGCHPAEKSLVILPEMFSTGFSMNVGSIAEADNGPAHQFLREIARTYQVSVIGGLTGSGGDGLGRNLAVVIAPDGSTTAQYQKIHPFSFGDEQRHYSPGNRVVTFSWGPFVLSPFICYDLRFPEVFRLAIQRGANLFVIIANWPASRQEHWTTLARARAIENQAYVAAVNRVGRDPNVEYRGGSLIVDPYGTIIAQADDQQQVLEAEVNIEAVEQWRSKFPALKDIRDSALS